MTDKDYDARYAMIAAFFDKGWITEAPTVEGWYWIYFPKSTYSSGVMCLRIGFDAEGKPWDVDNPEDPWLLGHVTHWLGPLPVPEPPE